MRFFLPLFLISILAAGIYSCGPSAEQGPAPLAAAAAKDPILFPKIKKDTTLLIAGVEVDILVPENYKADLLVLPGWNFSRTKWCSESSLCEKARAQGYRLILPEMGKSVYATNYFPETRIDWLKYPTLTWLTDTMILLLQTEYGIMRGDNYMIGLSTGARGVALAAARKPVFIAGAALSGDYDQEAMKHDNLMRGVYGEYDKFSGRWRSIDNPTNEIAKIDLPLYLGHGLDDKVVPASQTKEFYFKLKKQKPQLKIILSTPRSGHDFKYWNSEVDAVLQFFNTQRNQQ